MVKCSVDPEKVVCLKNFVNSTKYDTAAAAAAVAYFLCKAVNHQSTKIALKVTAFFFSFSQKAALLLLSCYRTLKCNNNLCERLTHVT